MKKILLFVLLTLALLMGTAYAEHPVNPHRQNAQPPSPVMPLAASKLSIAVNTVQGPSLTADTTWQISVSGGQAPYEYTYYVLDSDWIVNGHSDWTKNHSTYTYRFLVPGDYVLSVSVRDANGAEARKDTAFKVTGSAQTVAQKVAEIVRQCHAAVNPSDQYSVALWLHDWLVNHAYYDYTYSYYSADGVLFRGTGVCDSYSRAYELMLQKAGIEVKRITNIDHSWVIAKIDGAWYHIDPTWDDPGSATVLSSGSEKHDYFCLPDEVMALDHTTWEPSTNCTAYAACYMIRSGETKKKLTLHTEIARERVGNHLYNQYEDLFYTLDSFKTRVTSASSLPLRLSTANHRMYGQNAEGVYTVLMRDRDLYLTAYVLRQQVWDLRGHSVQYDVRFDRKAAQLVVDLDLANVFIPEALVAQSKRVPIGQPVTYTLKYYGEDTLSAVTYQVYHATKGLVAQSTAVSTTFTFTPEAEGTYEVRASLLPAHGEWTNLSSEPIQAFAMKPGTNNALGKLAIFDQNELVDYTGLAKYDGADYYFSHGVALTDLDGLVLLDGTWYAFTAGRLRTEEMFVPYDGGVFAFKNGMIDTSKNGLTVFNGEKFIFASGQFVPGVCGAWFDPLSGEWVYVWNSQFYDITDLVSYDGAIFYFVNGKLALNYRGTVKDFQGTVFNVVNGQVTGLASQTKASAVEEPGESPLPEPTVEPGSGFEAAIERNAAFTADVEGTVYYKVWLSVGLHDVRVRVDADERGAVEMMLFNAAKTLVWSGVTDQEGLLETTLPLEEGAYYVILTSNAPRLVEVALKDSVALTEEPENSAPEETAEEPLEETADEPEEEIPVADEAA